MKALLWKDICLLRRQLRLFIFAVLVFAAIPNGYIQLFAVAYASMLPYNTIALDEQSHWDQLAAMMPYSDRDVVLSKYLVGWGGCLAVGALALAASAVERPFFPRCGRPAGGAGNSVHRAYHGGGLHARAVPLRRCKGAVYDPHHGHARLRLCGRRIRRALRHGRHPALRRRAAAGRRDRCGRKSHLRPHRRQNVPKNGKANP